MATTRPDSADSSPAPAAEGAGWHALSMSAQYQLHAHLGRKLQTVYPWSRNRSLELFSSCSRGSSARNRRADASLRLVVPHFRPRPARRRGKQAEIAQGKDQVTHPPKESLRDAFVAAIPHLRAFALSLCRDEQRADDLVQEALVKGWQKRESFEQGTNLKAWLFTILRNNYFSDLRRKSQMPVEANGDFVERLSEHPAQSGHLDLQDFVAALGTLEPTQREALILVGAEGFTYEEAAQICGCPVGTIRSRVNRARRRLVDLLQVSAAEEYGPNPAYQSLKAWTPLADRPP
jgi:RNA polymerase sigma-70 factor (ECF subfamily)